MPDVTRVTLMTSFPLLHPSHFHVTSPQEDVPPLTGHPWAGISRPLPFSRHHLLRFKPILKHQCKDGIRHGPGKGIIAL